MDKQTARQNLEKLILKFKSEFEAGKTDAYNEESTKKSFIEPFLEDVLGWDVSNHDEVTLEEKVSRGKVDYGIKLNNKVVFFVEAKPVKYELEKAIPQAVKYCFNRKDVPFVLLTDFEGLMFFDATLKPNLRNIKKGLKINLKWTEYLEKFDEIWQLSKAEVSSGSLEKLFTLKPKDRISVDKSILYDLENWRESLAKNLYKNNKNLFHSDDRERDAQFLKEVTQKILDRIIFIRFCEDRQLTQVRQIKPRFDERGESVGINTYTYILSGLFREYENIFNSDLFKTQDWERDLLLDFKDTNEIIQQTYDPYMFDAIPIEVLGNIYEQYLGYTIKLSGDYLKYELKPEVRKAGGVYYTPEYIVDYIVKNTVGKLLQELPEAKAKKLRILDPACGSGSFLIRAYEEMIKYYTELKSKSKKSVVEGQTEIETPESGAKLTIQEKAEILKNHIFGVDIDEQAVEVTQLSLMLKMLEGELGFVKGTAVLPMLDKNIKCGNSLISGNQIEIKEFFNDDSSKIFPINWQEDFKEIIIDEGGFDIIIGNPPYGAEFDNKEKKYLINKYNLNSTDSACVFMALAYNLLKKTGINGFIIPKPFLYASNWYKIREKIINDLIIIVDCKKVWEEVKLEQIIYILQKNLNINYYDNYLRTNNKFLKVNSIQKNTFYDFGFILNCISQQELDLGYKIKSCNFYLNDYVINKRGGELQKYLTKNRDNYKVLGGKQIERFFLNDTIKGYINKKYIINSNCFIHPNSILVQNIIAHIENPYPHIKIICASTKRINIKSFIILDTVNQLQCKENIDADFICAILNSKLISWYVYRFICGKAIRTMHFDNFVTERIPIPNIDKRNKKYNDIIKLVDSLYTFITEKKNTKGEKQRLIQKQINKTLKEIDDFVCDLYGITEEERKIIEGDINHNDAK
ncbi:MAG: N-6 DNA methylase [Candidatus Goldbacteria bacterium]|nr:N-6 DNA methylase [Candidatus Goldiibacteriota bacterium]